MNATLMQTLSKFHLEAPEKEHCGIFFDGKILEFENIHHNPKDFFLINPNSLHPYLKKDFAFWHTHTCDGFDELTVTDIKMAKLWKRPIIMIKPSTNKFDFYHPKAMPSFEGREWKVYHENCYTIVQDYYSLVFKIKLPDFFLDYPTQYQSNDESKFLKHLQHNGFYLINNNEKNFKTGDLILTVESGYKEPWHCSVVAKSYPMCACLSNWVGRPSGYFPFRAIKNKVHSVWRHSNVKID